MTEINLKYDQTIKSHFPDENVVLIILFPFYRRIFADHYNWESDLKLTYPLLETITWQEISQEIGFKSIKYLAQGVLELKEPFKTELSEYCEWKKIDYPDYASDKIPEVLLIPLLLYLKNKGMKSIETKAIDRFPDSTNAQFDIESKGHFEIYNDIQDIKYFRTGNGMEILLPDYDCPYAIISGKREYCMDLVDQCGFEFFETDAKTEFDWWND